MALKSQPGLPMDLINTPISSVSCLNLDWHCTSFKKTAVKSNQTISMMKPNVLYMLFDRFLLAVESHDLSQAEKELTACKAE